ncbi:MAG: hypothetical protein PHY31_07115 [Smithellaceae bacterium]|nr:hypothetical protein [Smithellaceae bacterium]
MNDKEIEMIKRVFKAQDKLIKVINRIDKLPDAQRKKLEAMNIVGPKDDNKIADQIRECKEIKKYFRTKTEKQKSGYEGLTVDEIVARMTL